MVLKYIRNPLRVWKITGAEISRLFEPPFLLFSFHLMTDYIWMGRLYKAFILTPTDEDGTF